MMINNCSLTECVHLAESVTYGHTILELLRWCEWWWFVVGIGVVIEYIVAVGGDIVQHHTSCDHIRRLVG